MWVESLLRSEVDTGLSRRHAVVFIPRHGLTAEASFTSDAVRSQQCDPAEFQKRDELTTVNAIFPRVVQLERDELNTLMSCCRLVPSSLLYVD